MSKIRYAFNLFGGNLQNIHKNTRSHIQKVDMENTKHLLFSDQDTVLRKAPKDVGKTEIIKITFRNGSSKIFNMLFQPAKCLNNPLAEVLVKGGPCCRTSDWYWDKPPGGTGLFAVPLHLPAHLR